MIVVDTNVLSLFLYPNASVPDDFRTKQPIPHAKERVKVLVADIEQQGEIVIIPAPALAEALVVAAPDVEKYLEILAASPCFIVEPFGQKAAVEVALHLKAAKVAGDKRDQLSADDCLWDKVNFDRQIVAIAKTRGAIIYSTDRHIHHHAELWGVPHQHIADLRDPVTVVRQTELFDAKEQTPHTAPVDVRGSSDGHPESKAGTEGPQEKTSSQKASLP
jgi:hypothetical protein